MTKDKAYGIKAENMIPTTKEILKQCYQLKAQRKRKYVERSKFYKQNNICTYNAKQFYRETEKIMKPIEKDQKVKN